MPRHSRNALEASSTGRSSLQDWEIIGAFCKRTVPIEWLAAVWQAWRKAAAVLKRQSGVIEAMHRKRARRWLCAWHSYAAAQARRDDLLAAAFHNNQPIRWLAASFRGWRHWTDIKQASLFCAQQSMPVYEERVMLRALRGWHRRCCIRKGVWRIRARRRLLHLQRCLTHWAHHVRQRRRQLAAAQTHSNLRLLHQCFVVWRGQFVPWSKAKAVETAAQQLQILAFHRRSQHRLLCSLLACWHSIAASCKAARPLLYSTLHCAWLGGLFRAWQLTTAHQAWLKAAAVAGWKDRLEYVRRKPGNAAVASAAHTKRCMRKALRCWVVWCGCALAAHKSRHQKIADVFYWNRLAARYLYAIQVYAQHSVQKRKWEVKAWSQRRQLLAGCALLTWTEFAAGRRAKRAAVRWHNAYVRLGVLQSWYREAVQTQRALEFQAGSLVAWAHAVFKSWWQLTTARGLARSNLTFAAFWGWADYTAGQCMLQERCEGLLLQRQARTAHAALRADKNSVLFQCALQPSP
ncbi:hypothetical protein WJX72_003589 [[Myrmecia] bisecta]|uniref:Uncharacterized protein n=1 Tax=[Myrmecia] bisecta TaxID=41462 RepID=A0AAW1QQQ8_9CHLO